MPSSHLCANLNLKEAGLTLSVMDGTATPDELHDPVGTSRLPPLPKSGSGRPSSSRTEEALHLLIQMLHQQQATIKAEIQAQHIILRRAIDESLERALKEPVNDTNGESAGETEALLAVNGEGHNGAAKDEPTRTTTAESVDSQSDMKDAMRERFQDGSRMSIASTSASSETSVWNTFAAFPKDSPFDTHTCIGKMKSFIIGPLFDLISGIFVIMNTVAMFIDLDRQALIQARALGLETSSIWENTGDFWEVLEHVFNAVFLLELILRFWVFGWKLCHDLSILFDIFIVATSFFDAYVMPHLVELGEGQANLAFARLARLLRVIRVLRAFRAAALFSELRVLIRTLISSIMALVWSALLLGFMILSSGILMAQLVQGFIMDSSANYDHRVWAYRHYGGAARATYTMFEATLSGGWPNYARPVIENISPAFAFFWVAYVVAVIFAVIRVISALFLRTTMTAASNDDEMMVMGKMKEKDKFAKKLKKFFGQADKSGDGLISKDEFTEIMKDVKVQAWLQVLELEVYEVVALFNLLDDGTGEINCDEFVGGALRLKGNARAIDSIAIMHEQHKIHQGITQVNNVMKAIWQRVGKNAKENPWHVHHGHHLHTEKHEEP